MDEVSRQIVGFSSEWAIVYRLRAGPAIKASNRNEIDKMPSSTGRINGA